MSAVARHRRETYAPNFAFPPGMQDEPGGLLELRRVSKVYKSGRLLVPVLWNVNLVIREGEMAAVMGPSGSGKSTLMNIIGLLDRPSSGEVRIDGQAIDLAMPDAKLARLRAEKIGFVFQSFNLLPRASALSNVLLPTSYHRPAREGGRAHAEDLLRSIGLAARMHHTPAELSGGEKQRVAIARALVNNPDVILADEPTGNLDSASGREVIDILSDLHRQGKTVIIVTHDENVAAQCDRIITILDGRITSDTHD